MHLQTDRTIEFHAQGGIHYRTRIPKFGRDLAYHFPSCDLLVGAAGSEVYRLNLEQGRFLNPIQTDSDLGVNCTEVNPAHQLFGFGTASGTVEFWDPRSRSRVGVVQPQVPATFGSTDATALEVSALKFRHDGLSLAVGTNTGHTLLYDLRSSMPWLVKDHQYGFPIKSLNWHDGISASSSEGSGKVIVADCKIVKIWDRLNVSSSRAFFSRCNQIDCLKCIFHWFVCKIDHHCLYFPGIALYFYRTRNGYQRRLHGR